jgi:hypothetical protein
MTQCKQAYAGGEEGAGEHTDMAHRVTRWTFLVATLFFVPPAFAQTDNMPPPAEGSPPAGEPPMQPSMQGGPLPARGGGGLRVACGPDIARLCRGVPPGGGRIVQCLITRPGALSPMCRAHLAAREPGGGGAMLPPGSRADRTQSCFAVVCPGKIRGRQVPRLAPRRIVCGLQEVPSGRPRGGIGAASKSVVGYASGWW